MISCLVDINALVDVSMYVLCECVLCISSCWSLAVAGESLSANNGSVVSIIVLWAISYVIFLIVIIIYIYIYIYIY